MRYVDFISLAQTGSAQQIYNCFEDYFYSVIQEASKDPRIIVQPTFNKVHIELFIKWRLMDRGCINSSLFHFFIALSQTITSGCDETGKIVSFKCKPGRYVDNLGWECSCKFYEGIQDTRMWKIFNSLASAEDKDDVGWQDYLVCKTKSIRPLLIESSIIKKRNYGLKKKRKKSSLTSQSKISLKLVNIESFHYSAHKITSTPSFKRWSEYIYSDSFERDNIYSKGVFQGTSSEQNILVSRNILSNKSVDGIKETKTYKTKVPSRVKKKKKKRIH